MNDSATYYDTVSEDYDTMLHSTPGDRWIREAFRMWVVECLRPGAALLDFGCGTGTDAQWLAERGYTVLAYDPSKGMMKRLTEKCASEIRDCRIIPLPGGFDQILEQSSNVALDAVIANFAVLNHIADLEGFFQSAGRVLPPGGYVLASLSNAFFWKDIVRRDVFRPTWWKAVRASTRTGRITHVGAAGTVHRHLSRAIVRSSTPNFVQTGRAGVGALIRHRKGEHDWHAPSTPAELVERTFWKVPPVRSLGRYEFVKLSRRDA